MKSFLLAPALLSLVSAAVLPRAPAVTYDGYKVFRVSTNGSIDDTKAKLSKFTTDFWNRDYSDHIDVAIAPNQLNAFDALHLESKVLHEDLGKEIAGETVTSGTLVARQAADLSWFNSYHPWADHLTFLKNLQALLPSNSEIISQGKSLQGRDLFGIHIWGSGGKGSKAGVLWHGNVHAREWITSMTVEYATYQLITGYKNGDSSVKAIVDKNDFYIFPFVNPDGFVYSQTSDRLWRKNRQPPPSGSSCYGIDINRNWNYAWAGPDGASNDPCAQDYRGPSAAYTTENKGLASYVDSLGAGKGIKFYVDWHSYGQYLLTPYGYDCARVPSNQARYTSLQSGTKSAIAKRYGTSFTTGPSCKTLYATSGSSTDYVGEKGKAEFSITFELRDTGRYGFVLPASQIRPTGEEMWDGVKYWLQNM